MDPFCRTVLLDKHHFITLENVTKENDSDFHKVGPHRAILGFIEDLPTQWKAPQGIFCVGQYISDVVVFQSNEIVNFLDTLKKLDEDGSIAFFDPFTLKRLDETALHAEHGVELSEDETATDESEEEEEEEEVVSIDAGKEKMGAEDSGGPANSSGLNGVNEWMAKYPQMFKAASAQKPDKDPGETASNKSEEEEEVMSINAGKEEMGAEDSGGSANSLGLDRVNEWMAKYPQMFEAASAQKPNKDPGEEPRVVFMLPPDGDTMFEGKLTGITYSSFTLEYKL